ncbi:MAG: hypothetical protein ACOC1O_00455 [bacterium]
MKNIIEERNKTNILNEIDNMKEQKQLKLQVKGFVEVSRVYPLRKLFNSAGLFQLENNIHERVPIDEFENGSSRIDKIFWVKNFEKESEIMVSPEDKTLFFSFYGECIIRGKDEWGTFIHILNALRELEYRCDIQELQVGIHELKEEMESVADVDNFTNFSEIEAKNEEPKRLLKNNYLYSGAIFPLCMYKEKSSL